MPHLISINIDDALHIEREKDIEEQDLVAERKKETHGHTHTHTRTSRIGHSEKRTVHYAPRISAHPTETDTEETASAVYMSWPMRKGHNVNQRCFQIRPFKVMHVIY